jgi:glycosyltransferase involved in cell wall biosynthesis
MRLAIVASHPIQYQAPWFRALAKVTDLDVFFCHKQDADGQGEAGFGVRFEWDVPLLDGYRHHWLTNVSERPDVSTLTGCDTPDIADRLSDEGKPAFDACIVSGWYLKSYLQTIWGCKRMGIPVLSRGDSQLATNRGALWAFAKHVPYRWLLNAIDGHLYVGHANRRYLEHYGVSDDCLFFTPHFVDNEFFASGAGRARESGEAATFRAAQQLATDTVVFGFVGKLIDRKRPADFIQGIAAAVRHEPNVAGLIVGSGPLEHDLQRMALELKVPVRFAGFQNQSQLPRCYAALDALVLPSDASETWGLVVNEALACGRPAIVSETCGCSHDLIDEGQTGYTFPVGDIDALADRMVRTARASAIEREAYAVAARAKAARYSCATAVAGTLEALHSVTRPRHRDEGPNMQSESLANGS